MMSAIPCSEQFVTKNTFIDGLLDDAPERVEKAWKDDFEINYGEYSTEKIPSPPRTPRCTPVTPENLELPPTDWQFPDGPSIEQPPWQYMRLHGGLETRSVACRVVCWGGVTSWRSSRRPATPS